jgi:hypothetical protein
MNALSQRSWSPYLVGTGIGVLSWFAFATADRPLGITTAFEYTAALATRAASPAVQERNPYFREPDKSPKIDWEWALVVGVFLGALLSAKLSGDRTDERVPALWRARFGPSVAKRFAAAFIGGAVMMFGARLAQGCTSGHGISGALQLAVSSWLFLAALAVSAVSAAFALYGKDAPHV